MKIKVETEVDLPLLPPDNADVFDSNDEDDDNDDEGVADTGSQFQSEKMNENVPMTNGMDDSDNSSDMDPFKDSFLRGNSSEEVFDKLKQEELAANENKSSTTTTSVKQNINKIIEDFDNESQMDINDAESLFELPDTVSDMTVVSSETMETEMETVCMRDGLSEQKENQMPLANANGSKIPSKNQQLNKDQLQTSTALSMSTSTTTTMTTTMTSSAQPNKITGPRLLYEIQSEDGFTYKSTSITEIWEKLFETVQVARKAHGLTSLPVGPLADMCGYKMMGLKTNALKYLLEQLPGVEKCNNYKPVYHKRAESTISQASSSGYWSDCEEIRENAAGNARCEKYTGRSEYDMFSWLASRHRKQPMQIANPLSAMEMETMARRGTGSNLPMAMRYRTLKESYKDSVGVYRSHIHGRGLFCNRDIEAGLY